MAEMLQPGWRSSQAEQALGADLGRDGINQSELVGFVIVAVTVSALCCARFKDKLLTSGL